MIDYKSTVAWETLVYSLKTKIHNNLIAILQMNEVERNVWIDELITGPGGTAPFTDYWLQTKDNPVQRDADKAVIVNDLKKIATDHFVGLVKSMLEQFMTIKAEPVNFEGVLPPFEGLNDVTLMYPDLAKKEKPEFQPYGFEPYGITQRGLSSKDWQTICEKAEERKSINNDWISHSAPTYAVPSTDCGSAGDGGACTS